MLKRKVQLGRAIELNTEAPSPNSEYYFRDPSLYTQREIQTMAPATVVYTGCNTGLCPPKATSPMMQTMSVSQASTGAEIVTATQFNETVAPPVPAPKKASLSWLPLILAGVALVGIAAAGDADKKESKASGLSGVKKMAKSKTKPKATVQKSSSKRVKSYSI